MRPKKTNVLSESTLVRLIPSSVSVGAVNSDISLRSITAITDRSIIGSLLRHLLSKDSTPALFPVFKKDDVRMSSWVCCRELCALQELRDI